MPAPKELNVPKYEINEDHPYGNYQRPAVLQKQDRQSDLMKIDNDFEKDSLQQEMVQYKHPVKELLEPDHLQENEAINILEDENPEYNNTSKDDLDEKNIEKENEKVNKTPDITDEQSDSTEMDDTNENEDSAPDLSNPIEHQNWLDNQATAAQKQATESDEFDIGKYQYLAKYFNNEIPTDSVIDVALDDVSDMIPQAPDEIEIEDKYIEETSQNRTPSINMNEHQLIDTEIESKQNVDYPSEALELVNKYEQSAASWESQQQVTAGNESLEYN